MTDLLRVRGLHIHFRAPAGILRAVEDLDITVDADETLGLVGESGSGKTVTSLALMRLVPAPGFIAAGELMFEGQDLRALSERQVASLRGRRMAMVFQNPATSLNPLLTVGAQLGEILMWHEGLGRRAAAARVEDLLGLVGIADPAARLRQFPHELSGGMKQRVCIARALLCNPALLLADEPTTALDVTIQAQVLDLLAALKQRLRMSMVLVTHDMGVAARMTDRITVMYAGRVCETAPTRTIYAAPLHPYTRALLASVPRTDRSYRRDGVREKLPVISGRLPSLLEAPSGCRFHPRCSDAIADCAQVVPLATEVAPGHLVSCIRAGSRSVPVA